jgi:ketosteroid isomerase-like protein
LPASFIDAPRWLPSPGEAEGYSGGATTRDTVATGAWQEASMDRNHFAVWLDAYVEAWRSNDKATIARLFSENVQYFYGPYAEPVVGRDAVVASWLESPDEPNSWQAQYVPLAVDGDVLVATGESVYFEADGTTVRTKYNNIFVCRFDADGRCREFREWFMEQPKAGRAAD